jgi:hypothetical protein
MPILQPFRKIALVGLILLIGKIAISQDLESLSWKNAVKISGGIGFQTTSYSAFGMPMNRDPLLMQVNLNLNINVLGVVSLPLSASFSNQGSSYSTPQPFNTFGMSPKYKAVTLHLGYRSINLSEFSLNGSQFLGVGLEIMPKESFIKGKALWGRFAKPIYFNPDGTIATMPSFARFGWGAGITLGSNPKKEWTINIFKAKDDPESLDVPATELENRPADNLVLGVAFKNEISKKISIDGEADISFYTNDLTDPPPIDDNNSFANNIFLFDYNGTSEFKKAVLFGINYKPDFATFKIEYRRVDPDYKTLGTAFINNDYEDWKLKTSFSILDKKTGFTLSGGVQRNNLSNTKVTKMRRLIGSIGVNHKINDKWNSSASYSNFNSNTQQTIVITLDSLKFVQTTQSANIALTRTVSKDNSNSSLNIGFNFQDALVNEVKTTMFYNGNAGWQKQFLKSKISIGANLVLMHNISEVGSTSNIGPSAMFGTSIFKDKLTINLVAAYLPSYTDLIAAGSVSNITLGGSYAIFKKHKIAYNISNIIKVSGNTNTTEITASINYKYSF